MRPQPKIDVVLPCVVCGRTLNGVFDDQQHNQPHGATSFQAHGQYGSTVFDPMDASYLEVNVCDNCLKSAGARNAVLLGIGKRELGLWTRGVTATEEER